MRNFYTCSMKLCVIALNLAFFSSAAFAARPTLKKVPAPVFNEGEIPGYDVDVDDLYRVVAGPLAGRDIFFASVDAAAKPGCGGALFCYGRWR